MVELHPLTPQLILVGAALVLLVYDAVFPDSEDRGILAGIATIGALGSLGVSAFFLLAETPRGTPVFDDPFTLFRDQLVVDTMALFLAFLVAAVTAMVAVASYDYLRGIDHQAEYYSLLMFAATGMSLMATANSLATAFVALELASLPSYALVAFLKHNRGSVEAGLKYFLIGALSSAVFVYGVSLVYGATGSLLFSEVAAGLSGAEGMSGLLGIGILMVLGGFAFKTASVPFHFWAPEAYEGAVAPISGFISSASKAAGFFLAFRVFLEAFPQSVLTDLGMGIDWVLAFQIIAIVTMTVGNFAAATQENVKRMLAYSSVGHAGYALIGLAALNSGQNALVLGASMSHLMVYAFMNTGAFLFIALVEYWEVGRTFEDYNGLANKAPMACFAMTIFMFSLAGLPVGGGFLSKYFLFVGTISTGIWWLGAALVVNSALSLYYYTRVVKAIWIEEPTTEHQLEGYPTGLYLALLAAALVTVAMLPGFGFVFETAQNAAGLVLP
ncbi:MAG: NADH-quinone oxidoreductase subunit N [Halobacteriales archaeon]